MSMNVSPQATFLHLRFSKSLVVTLMPLWPKLTCKMCNGLLKLTQQSFQAEDGNLRSCLRIHILQSAHNPISVITSDTVNDTVRSGWSSLFSHRSLWLFKPMSDPLTLVITSMISSLFILNVSVLFCCTSACLFTVVSLRVSTDEAVKDETDKTDKIEPHISAGVGVTKAATSARQRAVKAATLKGFRSVRSKRAVVEKGKPTHRLPSCFMIYEGVTLAFLLHVSILLGS